MLFGCGGHAKSCIDVIEKDSRFEIVGLVGQAHEVGTEVLGYPVIATDQNLDGLRKLSNHACIAVGQIKSPDLRISLFNKLASDGWQLPSIVSPFAYVSKSAQISIGTVVMHGATVNSGAKLGKNCIVNSHSLVEHDCIIGDHCHIATGAILNGAVTLGDACFVGSRAVIREGISIKQGSIITLGEVVRKNL